MTAQKPFDPHPPAGDNAVTLNGAIHVMRTGWVETAIITKQRGNCPLVKADQDQEEFAHFVSPGFLAQ
jgi:hypothetical protein